MSNVQLTYIFTVRYRDKDKQLNCKNKLYKIQKSKQNTLNDTNSLILKFEC